MKKTISIILCAIMVFISLSSCSKSIEEEIIDVWGGEVGSSLVTLEILENGNCLMIFMDKYDSDLEIHNGTWTLNKKTVTCKIKSTDGDDTYTFTFKYKNDKLVSGDISLVRQNLD